MSSWQSFSIDLDNGLAPIRRQAIAWTNADPIHWSIYAALWGDGLCPVLFRIYKKNIYLKLPFAKFRPFCSGLSMRQWIESSLVQVMACRLFSAKPLLELMLAYAYCQLGLLGTNFCELWIGILSFSFKEMPLKMSSAETAAILSRGKMIREGAEDWICKTRPPINGVLAPLVSEPKWTHRGLVVSHGHRNLDQQNADNSLLPEGTKPLPKPILIIINEVPWCSSYGRWISDETHDVSRYHRVIGSQHIWFQPPLPGVTELMKWYDVRPCTCMLLF